MMAAVMWGQVPAPGTAMREFRLTHTTGDQAVNELLTAIRLVGGFREAHARQTSLWLRGTPEQLAVAEWLVGRLDADAPPAGRQEYRARAADDVVRVFLLTNNPTPQAAQQIATTLRSVADLRYLFTTHAGRALTIRGEEWKAVLAEWLIARLDVAAAPSGEGPQEYQIPGVPDGFVRVFYPARATQTQDLQQLVTAVRSTANVRRIFCTIAPPIVALRGTADEVRMAEWMIHELEQPTPAAGVHELRMPGGGDDVLRVFYLQYGRSPSEIQELTTLIRSIANIPRLFLYHPQSAIAMRGTGQQLGMAEWMLAQLDSPRVRPPARRDYAIPGAGDDAIRIHYLAHDLALAPQIRATVGIKSLFGNSMQNALILRGRSAELDQATRIVEERDR
jgi:hypothetical protein